MGLLPDPDMQTTFPSTADDLLAMLVTLYPATDCVVAVSRGDQLEAVKAAARFELVTELTQLREDTLAQQTTGDPDPHATRLTFRFDGTDPAE